VSFQKQLTYLSNEKLECFIRQDQEVEGHYMILCTKFYIFIYYVIDLYKVMSLLSMFA